MYIKDIILDGFKIYENKTVIRNLNKTFNAITGLNGSGKSNIIDGIIFALGLENKKLLRTTTFKELININRKECKVSLILSNADKTQSPEGYKEYDELIIARSIDINGKTKFYLNNHVCALSTISKLCLKMNLNADKGEFFFIIMQGHITQVLNMKSKEIGALIEETAGTRSYSKEKEKAIYALHKKETKLIEVRDTLQKRIAPFYSRLREDREAFVEQKKFEQVKQEILNEQKMLKSSIDLDNISKHIVDLREAVKNFADDKQQLTEIEKKLCELQDIDSEDNLHNIKEMLEDEKLKLEGYKNNNKEKLEKLRKELEKIQVPQKKYNLEELKEKENVLLKSIKFENGIVGQDYKTLEELELLKGKKIELEIQYNNIPAVNIDEVNKKITLFEKYKVSDVGISALRDRLSYLKLKINYPIRKDVYGTVDENIILRDDKYKEAVFTVLGSKAKHIIVLDEKTGASLLNNSERRISIIPLNKIKSKYVDKSVVNSCGGLHVIDLISYDSNIKKAIEHVFSGFFVFEDKEKAKKICYEKKVVCITLDGSVYDPKGTLTGGKYSYNNEIIRGSEILELQDKIAMYEKNALYLQTNKTEYESLRDKKKKNEVKNNLYKELKNIETKIEAITKYNLSTSDAREELTEIRKNIIEAIKEDQVQAEYLNKKTKMVTSIEDLEKSIKKDAKSEEDCISRIMKLQEKLGQYEIKNSHRRLSERQIEGLEPKQQYLVRSTVKLKTRISKIYQDLCLLLEDYEKEEINFYNSENLVNSKIESLITDEYEDIYNLLGIDKRVFSIPINELSKTEHEQALDRLKTLQSYLDKNRTKGTIRMDPANFDLLEKNEMIIETLKEKIIKLENDKLNIMNSISNFDTLGLEENKKAFEHMNRKIPVFLKYFFSDSDVKITKTDTSEYELKVKIGNWKDSLTELSGGQRSLVALCLVFSILTYRPAPFYIFDEIDSALDLSYTQSIGEIIKNEFNNSQFIVISLKDGMYESASNVYKVYIKDGKSNICQIK